jgi:hypothetical protein
MCVVCGCGSEYYLKNVIYSQCVDYREGGVLCGKLRNVRLELRNVSLELRNVSLEL